LNGSGTEFRHNAQDVAANARHRGREILIGLAGINERLLDGRHHECPKCGGTDRFRLIDAEAGAVLCNKCFATNNGDSIAAAMWMLGVDRGEAIDRVGDYLGLTPQNGGEKKQADPLGDLCRAKRMSITSAIAYGAKVNGDGVEFPSWGPDGSALSLCDRLSEASQFYQLKKGEEGELIEVDVIPPLRIARIVHSRRRYPGVPSIEGIIHAPAFLADGSVLTNRGYDRATGLYLAGSCDFPPVPQSPTLADAEKSRDELLEVVCDFPFAGEAHRAAWLAMAITPAARFAFDGPTPLGAFDANVRGSGKSKLSDSIGMIHLGTDMPRTAYPDSDDELRKAITAALLASERLMLLDNVARMLGGPALDALLTATGWNERILGVSKLTGRLQATTIWMASGNNLTFGADTARRALVCRLQSPDENPEEREGFKHTDLLGWVKRNRGRLAVAAITILRAYHVAGRPNMDVPEWGSFEGWSRLVRNAVIWCGMDDPGATRQEVREQSDREAGLLRQLLAGWEDADPAGFGMTIAEAIGKAGDCNQALQAVFAEIGTPGKPPNPRSIGMKIHHLRGRVAGGKYFDRRNGPNHTPVWRVDTAGTKGTEGTKASPLRGRAHTHAHAHTRGVQDSPSSSPPSPISPPACNHLNPEAWTRDGDQLLCPGCGKFMGRARQGATS